MILYHKDTWFGSIRFFGSVLPRSVPQALASLLLCIALVYYAEAQAEFLEQAADSPLGDVGATVIYAFCSNPYVHQVSMLSISFVIAFRVNLAYARWWEGIGLLHNMRSKWVDAVVQLIAFDAVPPTDRSAAPLVPSAADFRVLIAHLFSLLHACAVLEVKKSWDVNCLVARKPKPAPAQAASGHFTACVVHFFPWSQDLLEKPRPRYEIIQAEVLGGISLIERQALLDMESSWVEHMHLRIVRVVCDRISNGGLNMDPPILSRIFQEISSGTLLCTGAQKISQVPFPFPFYELIRLIKWYFIVSNPFILVSFTTHPVIAGMMCFFSTLFFVAIIEVAEELEDPFGEDANDLPIMDLHAEFNEVVTKMIFFPPHHIDALHHPDGVKFRADLALSMKERLDDTCGSGKHSALYQRVKSSSDELKYTLQVRTADNRSPGKASREVLPNARGVIFTDIFGTRPDQTPPYSPARFRFSTGSGTIGPS